MTAVQGREARGSSPASARTQHPGQASGSPARTCLGDLRARSDGASDRVQKNAIPSRGRRSGRPRRHRDLIYWSHEAEANALVNLMLADPEERTMISRAPARCSHPQSSGGWFSRDSLSVEFPGARTRASRRSVRRHALLVHRRGERHRRQDVTRGLKVSPRRSDTYTHRSGRKGRAVARTSALCRPNSKAHALAAVPRRLSLQGPDGPTPTPSALPSERRSPSRQEVKEHPSASKQCREGRGLAERALSRMLAR